VDGGGDAIAHHSPRGRCAAVARRKADYILATWYADDVEGEAAGDVETEAVGEHMHVEAAGVGAEHAEPSSGSEYGNGESDNSDD